MTFRDVIQWASLLMIVPSTVLVIFIVHVIRSASPKAMASYKNILIGMTLVCYNFDFVVSFAVAPRNFPGIVGAQLAGAVARTFPSSGPWLMFACFLSLGLQIGSSAVGFCYREHTVTITLESRVHYYVRVAQMFLLPVMLSLLAPCYFGTANTEEETREYLKNISLVPCDGCGVFLVTRQLTLQVGGVYSALFVAMVLLFVIKSVYRIRTTLANHKNMSISTVRLQKMLLKALLWQSIMPFALIIVPVLILMFNFILFPMTSGVRQTNEFSLSVTGLAIAMPSLFTVAHVFCIVYFTTPYRTYLLERKTPSSSGTDPSPRKVTRTTEIE